MSSQYRFSGLKMTTTLHPRQLAEAADLKVRIFGCIKLDTVGQAFLALGAVRRICQSDASEIIEAHIARYGRLAGGRATMSSLRSELLLSTRHARCGLG